MTPEELANAVAQTAREEGESFPLCFTREQLLAGEASIRRLR